MTARIEARYYRMRDFGCRHCDSPAGREATGFLLTCYPILATSNMVNLSSEINFQTTRSGGKGGQNVNKVETAVIGSWPIELSSLFTDEQKAIIKEKLSNRITSEGYLQVKSQVHRTQLANKEEVIEKINQLVSDALKKKKLRIPTRKSKASKEKRLESKKKQSEIKSGRKKFKPGEY
jgi:ribosome-associated protein